MPLGIVDGTSGPDVIDAGFVDTDLESITAGNDIVNGGLGDDILAGGAGADDLFGGADIDTASCRTSSGLVQVDLTTGICTAGDAQGDDLFLIENLEGSQHEDVLIGDSGVNRIDGGLGADFIEGRGGADTLIGGSGGVRDVVGYIASPAGSHRFPAHKQRIRW